MTFRSQNRLLFLLSFFFSFSFVAFSQGIPDFAHPRGLVKASEVYSIRERVQKYPHYSAVLEQMKQKVLLEAKTSEAWSPYQLSDAALENAQIYLLTGDSIWAERARQHVEVILQDTGYFQNPIGRGLTKADQLLKVMMAYDYCYAAWDTNFKKRFCQLTYKAILTLSSNMGIEANYNLASNWMGVRYGTVLYAALIWDDFAASQPKKSKIRPFMYDAIKRVSDFALANVHPDGWNVESLGYQNYGWSFVFPALIAWQNHYDIPLKEFDFYERMIAGHQAWATASIPISSRKGIGMKPDFSDDGLNAADRLIPFVIHLAPNPLKPHFRWVNRFFNEKKKGPQIVDGGFTSILYDDPKEEASTLPQEWLTFLSPGQGIVTLRNQFKDEQDIVFAFSATSSREGHQGGDNLSFRLIGLDNIWAVGSGRTNWIGGQTSFFPIKPTDTSKFKNVLGTLDKVSFGKKKTTIVGSGSCTGVQNHTRSIGVRFDSISSRPAATILVKDVSDNGKIWRLNTPEFNQIKLSDDGFEIIGPNGNKLIGQVKKNKLKNYQITTGAHRYGGNTVRHNYGIPYYGKQYAESKYIDVECDGSLVVELNLFKAGL